MTSKLFTGSLQLLSSGPIMHGKNVHLVTGWHPNPNKSQCCHCAHKINGNLLHLNYLHRRRRPPTQPPPHCRWPPFPVHQQSLSRSPRAAALCEGSALFIFPSAWSSASCSCSRRRPGLLEGGGGGGGSGRLADSWGNWLSCPAGVTHERKKPLFIHKKSLIKIMPEVKNRQS